MKNRYRLIYLAILLALVFQSIIAHASTDPRMLMKRVQEKMKAAKSISYDVKYRFKCLDCDDTMTYEAHVDLLRVPTDSLAGCYLLARLKNGSVKLYDGKNTYWISQKDTSVTIYDNSIYRWNPTKGNTMDNIFSKGFLDPSKLDYFVDPAVDITVLRDSNIGGERKPLTSILIKPENKESDEFIESPSYRIIDPNIDFVIYNRDLLYWKAQSKYQYDEASYSNVEFDRVHSDYFKNYQMPTGYRIVHYKPKQPLDQKLLSDNTQAPDFIAKKFPDTASTMKLSDYRGKIVVLDFWYMSCYPCIQALPALEEINKKYADKGVVVLGVNSTDLRVKRVHKLPDFFQHNPITYSTIMPEKSVDETYHVKGYPTMYVIDKNGTIVLSQEGYGPTVESVLTDKLDELLK